MPKGDTKLNLTKATSRLLWTNGYYGTGIQEVLKVAGVPKGSLYHHFPEGKDGLVKAALRYSSGRMMEVYESGMRGTKTPVKGLSAILEKVGQEMLDSEYRRGCPLATVTMELDHSKEDILQVCQDMYQAWEDALTGYLALKQVSNPRPKARQFLMLLEGAFVLSKAHRDIRFLDFVRDQVPALLQSE